MMNDETTVASCVKNVCENQGTCLQMKKQFSNVCVNMDSLVVPASWVSFNA